MKHAYFESVLVTLFAVFKTSLAAFLIYTILTDSNINNWWVITTLPFVASLSSTVKRISK